MFKFLLRWLNMGVKPDKKKLEFVSIEKIKGDKHDCLLTMRYGDTHNQYRGSSTVWRDAQTGNRVGVHLEGQFADLWTKHIVWSEV